MQPINGRDVDDVVPILSIIVRPSDGARVVIAGYREVDAAIRVDGHCWIAMPGVCVDGCVSNRTNVPVNAIVFRDSHRAFVVAIVIRDENRSVFWRDFQVTVYAYALGEGVHRD